MVCPLRFGVFGISAVIALFAVLFTWASHCSGEQHPPAQPTAKVCSCCQQEFCSSAPWQVPVLTYLGLICRGSQTSSPLEACC